MKNCVTAMNAFKLFLARGTMMASDITARTLADFESYLKDRPRAVSLYCSCVAIFNDARLYYNDEENGTLTANRRVVEAKG